MKILFISWDSDQTNYLENLFFPIFQGLQRKLDCQFFILQFSWAEASEVERISKLAQQRQIGYEHRQVGRKPHPMVGSLLAVVKGRKTIKKLIEKHGITHLMPRSTMPALMVNPISAWLKKKGVKVIFDADGFPLQERIDFVGLKKNSLQFRWLKKAETKMLHLADLVLVRSNLAKDIHLQNIGFQHQHKFFKVSNGKNKALFKPDSIVRENIRKELGIAPSTLLWLYSGSLGPQYLLDKMLDLFETYHHQNTDSRFLFLVRNEADLKTAIPEHLKDNVFIKSVAYHLVPAYYAAADLGISLRKSAPSLAGIAPIKVSEYLLSGLPVLLSEGIGDLDEMVGCENFCFTYGSHNEEKFFEWLGKLKALSRETTRSKAIPLFDLKNSLREYENALMASNT